MSERNLPGSTPPPASQGPAGTPPEQPPWTPGDPWAGVGQGPTPAWLSAPPGPGSPSYPGAVEPPYADPPPETEAESSPRRRRRTSTIVAAVVAVSLVFCGGVGAGWLFLNAGNSDPATPAPGPQTGAASAPPVDLPPVPPGSASDVRLVTKGQCLKNEGSQAAPRLSITECAPGTYQVLARFDEATTGAPDAKARCADVAGYTDWYFHNSDLDSLDYVLCLRRRS